MSVKLKGGWRTAAHAHLGQTKVYVESNVRPRAPSGETPGTFLADADLPRTAALVKEESGRAETASGQGDGR